MQKASFSTWKRLRLLLLLTVAIPLSAIAQSVSMPFLCIEKTNGEVVKVLINETGPDMWYVDHQDPETMLYERSLQISRIPTGEDDIQIPCNEIKCVYSRFEEVSAVEYVKADTEEQASEVYTVSGLFMGKLSQLKRMPRGLYLVKKGSQTIKVVNK